MRASPCFLACRTRRRRGTSGVRAGGNGWLTLTENLFVALCEIAQVGWQRGDRQGAGCPPGVRYANTPLLSSLAVRRGSVGRPFDPALSCRPGEAGRAREPRPDAWL